MQDDPNLSGSPCGAGSLFSAGPSDGGYFDRVFPPGERQGAQPDKSQPAGEQDACPRAPHSPAVLALVWLREYLIDYLQEARRKYARAKEENTPKTLLVLAGMIDALSHSIEEVERRISEATKPAENGALQRSPEGSSNE